MLRAFILGLLFSLVSAAAPAASDIDVYRDNIISGWDDWSWDVTLNPGAASPVHAGSASLGVTYSAAWGGLYFAHDGIDASLVNALTFWINGGPQGGQKLSIALYVSAGASAPQTVSLTAPAANTWTSCTLPLASFGNPASIQGIVFQDASGGAFHTFYLDDVVLQASFIPASELALSVDETSVTGAISPYIYGMNFASKALAAELKLPVRRWGGNATTRFNYQFDASNHASDWYFENIPEDNANPSALPEGNTVNKFIEQDRETGSASIITMPLIGWTPKSRAYAAGFSVAKYGAQQSVDPYRTDMGNGVRPDGSHVTGNDPLDTSVYAGPSFDKAWIQYLTGKYGTAASGGVRFYNLDNEPMLWNSTHRDVHPAPVSYDELLSRTLAYGAAIKQADPAAQTLGPVLWGWTAYFYSALDSAAGGNWWNNPVDRNAHGGKEFAAWYLQQLKAYETAHGTRLLDYFDLHYYPQANGVTLSTAGGSATQALRLRSTRALWDPGYTDESWIAEPVMLIPRMRGWVAANYPGTKLAMTEYNWGGVESINGALAQADVLGIFGREGLDLATMWGPPEADQPAAFAFRMYRNYDGKGAMFGETGLGAKSSSQDKLSIYAARRESDRALTVMMINKTAGDLPATLTLTTDSARTAAGVYRYSAADLTRIQHLENLPIASGKITLACPANSITLLVIPSGSAARKNWAALE